MLKIFKILFFFTFIFFPSFGQKTFPYKINLSAHAGAIMDKEDTYYLLIHSYVSPLDISVSRLATGNEPWKEKLQSPYSGFSFLYTKLPNKQVLGELYAVRSFLEFTVLSAKNISFQIKPYAGIAYATHTFDPKENYKNLMIGSHILANFGLAGMLSYEINNHYAIHAGMAFNHFSNGQWRLPNNGLNLTTLEGGIKYGFGQQATTEPKEFTQHKKEKKVHFSMLSTVGLKQIDFFYNNTFITASVSLESAVRINFLQNVGAGVALFYDESNKVDYDRKHFTSINASSNYIGGVYLLHEFNLYPVIIPFQIGYYALNANAEYRSKVFNRFGIRFFITPDLFLNITHKSDFFFRGDNIEWGVGYKF